MLLKIESILNILILIHVVSADDVKDQNLVIQCKTFHEKGSWHFFPNHTYNMCIDEHSAVIVHQPGMGIIKITDQDGKDLEKLGEIEAVSIQNATMEFFPINFKTLFPRLRAFQFFLLWLEIHFCR